MKPVSNEASVIDTLAVEILKVAGGVKSLSRWLEGASLLAAVLVIFVGGWMAFGGIDEVSYHLPVVVGVVILSMGFGGMTAMVSNFLHHAQVCISTVGTTSRAPVVNYGMQLKITIFALVVGSISLGVGLVMWGFDLIGVGAMMVVLMISAEAVYIAGQLVLMQGMLDKHQSLLREKSLATDGV